MIDVDRSALLSAQRYIEELQDIEMAEENRNPIKIDTICVNLARALTKLFPDKTCIKVDYTKNIDKNFFGMYVLPEPTDYDNTRNNMIAGLSNSYDSYALTKEFEKFEFNKYRVDIDGRLFRDFQFNAYEVLALLIGEIEAIVYDNIPEKIRNIMDQHIFNSGIHIDCANIIDTTDVFFMVCAITAHNFASVFAKSKAMVEVWNNDIPAVVHACGLDSQYYEAIRVLVNKSSETEEQYMPAILMAWYLNNLSDISNGDVLYALQQSAAIEPSTAVKGLYMRAIQNLSSVYNNSPNKIVTVQESKRKGLIWKMKRDGLKSIEEDLFEFQMRLRNTNTQDEAILLVRQINSRMSILEDYLMEEGSNLEENDKKRWEKCYEGYVQLRETLSKKTIYDKKMYGLFVDYNALQTMSQTGQLNTYY